MTSDTPYVVRISPSAFKELAALRAYIAGEGRPQAAERYVEKLLAAITTLETFPGRGRPVTRSIRELTTVPPYVIRYSVRGNRVNVTRIRHGARRPTK